MGSPLSEEQSEKEFIFTVSFSDNGAYIYQKTDGTAGELASGGTLTLSHGETALFEQIPAGVTYTDHRAAGGRLSHLLFGA